MPNLCLVLLLLVILSTISVCGLKHQWFVQCFTFEYIIDHSVWELTHQCFVMLRLVILSTITSRSLAHESSHWCGRLYCRHTCWKLDTWFVVCYIVDITVCGLTHQWFELQVFEYKLVVLLGYVILMTIAVWDVSPQRFMLSKLLFEVWHVSGWTTYTISDYHH